MFGHQITQKFDLSAGVLLIVRPPFLFGGDDGDETEDSAAESGAAGWTEFSAALIVVLGAVLQSNVFVLLRMLRGKLTIVFKRSNVLRPNCETFFMVD